MRLTELEPRWLTPNLFAFRCPCCRTMWLTCKDVAPMGWTAQFEAFEAAGLTGDFVSSRKEYAWQFSTRDFDTLTVTPSIDASNAKHWHGFITNGEIR